MASAAEWVRQIIATSQTKPMATEAVLKSLERHIGLGDKALPRVQAVLEYIDGELVERRGGLVMRDLWATVADYIEKVQEAQAAA
ncbi:hypothetical protein K2X33_07610 [bacterium]|nr:hypothetical protein [bacterium]